MRRGRRDRARGAMILIMAGVLVLMAVLALGVLTILRLVVARKEVQRVADAACLAATTIVKHDGLPFDDGKRAAAAAIAGRNHPGVDFRLVWAAVDEAPDRVDIQCQVSLDVAAPAMIWSSGRMVVTGSAQGTVRQVTETQATKLYPKLALVLDFSNSMYALRLGGSSSGPRTIDALRTDVNLLLDLQANIKYGLVIFADGVVDKMAIHLDSLDEVRKKVMGHPKGCPERGTCTTHSMTAMAETLKLFQQSDATDEAWYVLFVSDGMPNGSNDPEGDTVKQAVKLWDAGATILTLHLINQADHDYAEQLKKFMVSLSGDPDHRGVEQVVAANGKVHKYYYNADSDAALKDAFKKLSGAIGCPLTALDPPPADPNKIHVFIKDASGAETPLVDAARFPPPGSDAATDVGDLADDEMGFYQGDYYFYRAKNHTIYVTPPVCDRVLNEHDAIVIRSGSVQLTE